MTNATLEVRGLHATVEGKEILRGIGLTVRQGEIHALMGPNGSGKSTLSNVIMGRPGYAVTKGSVVLNGEDITGLTADERAKRGLFLAMQYPTEIPGVSVVNFLRTAYQSTKASQVSALEFRKHMKTQMDRLDIEDSMVQRYVNQGFSGGEKKRNEVLQLAVLEPEIALLDETDSGLDIDSLKVVAESVNELAGPNLGVLIITHYQRMLNYITPQFVHVMMQGKIVKSGGPELAHRLEDTGYEGIRRELGLEEAAAHAEEHPRACPSTSRPCGAPSRSFPARSEGGRWCISTRPRHRTSRSRSSTRSSTSTGCTTPTRTVASTRSQRRRRSSSREHATRSLGSSARRLRRRSSSPAGRPSRSTSSRMAGGGSSYDPATRCS